MKVLVVERNKAPELREIGDDLKDMQAIVGGYIEAVYFDDPVALVCNEEGKLIGLPVNRFLWHAHTEYVDPICGTFFLCGCGDEDFVSIPEDLIDKYIAMFRKDIVKI